MVWPGRQPTNETPCMPDAADEMTQFKMEGSIQGLDDKIHFHQAFRRNTPPCHHKCMLHAHSCRLHYSKQVTATAADGKVNQMKFFQTFALINTKLFSIDEFSANDTFVMWRDTAIVSPLFSGSVITRGKCPLTTPAWRYPLRDFRGGKCLDLATIYSIDASHTKQPTHAATEQ